MGVKIHFFNLGGEDKQKGYEGSAEDSMQDYAAARRKGVSSEHYEDTAHDRIADKAGEKRVKDKEAKKEAIQHDTSYKPGVSAYKNPPKFSHGYGHTESQRQGHLRMSGKHGAHRIGGKR